jgi:hypothetical protein
MLSAGLGTRCETNTRPSLITRKAAGLDDADTIEGAQGIVQDESPGVDEIRTQPLRTGQGSSAWEHRIRSPIGRANRSLLLSATRPQNKVA